MKLPLKIQRGAHSCVLSVEEVTCASTGAGISSKELE